MHQYAEACDAFEQVLALDANSAGALVGRGYCYYERGDWNNAVSDFRRGIALGKKDKEAQVYLPKAEEHLRNSNRNVK